MLDKEKKATAISYYFRDLNNGPWIGIDEDEPHSPASLIKIPLAMAYYKQAELTPEILKQEILNVSEENTDEQNIKPESKLQANTSYTVEQLIQYMLVHSSNEAFKLLNKYLYAHDSSKLSNIYVDLGIKLSPDTPQNPNGNIISVREYASFFRILYNSSYLSKMHSEHMLQYLSTTTFDEGIVGGVPAGTTVSHKYGERYFEASKEHQLHDCGIIYAAHKPYLLCIMTRGNDLEELSSIIRDISASTYRTFVEKK